MNQSQNVQPQGSFLADCARIYREWHDRAKAIDTEGLLALYAEDAVFLESPLVPAILDDKSDGRANCAGFSSRAGGDAQMISCAGIAQAND